jgi:hypothetical protein
MAKRFRDKRGRFCRPPKAPPLDPAIVKALGQNRRPAIIWTDDYELVVSIVHPQGREDRGD